MMISLRGGQDPALVTARNVSSSIYGARGVSVIGRSSVGFTIPAFLSISTVRLPVTGPTGAVVVGVTGTTITGLTGLAIGFMPPGISTCAATAVETRLSDENSRIL